jgi:hypothetical protein
MSNVWIEAGNVQAISSNITNLTWVPQEMGLVKPVQDKSYQVVDDYYHCYSFEHFVNLTNNAILQAYNTSGNPGGSPNDTTYMPKCAYDDTVKTFYWTLPSEFTGNALSTTGWSVCWNEEFDNLVNNFNTIETQDSNGDKLFILESVDSALTNTNASGNVVLYQDYPTTDYFNSAERILVTTTSIPIAQDFMPAELSVAGGLSARERVLADVNLDFDNDITAQRSIIKFNQNTDLLNMNDIISTLPIQRISVKFRWVDSRNKVYDIPLSKNDTVTCKIGFFNKKLLLDQK